MATVLSQLRVSRDPLTGLHASLPVAPHGAVLLVDIDGLGEVNGDRGQAAGDDVLRATAGLLRELTPSGGQAFRIGADEFVVTLGRPPRAGRRVDRVGAALPGPARLGRTVSVGVAVGAPGGECGEALVSRAGEALGEAKRLGSDGVVDASAKASQRGCDTC